MPQSLTLIGIPRSARPAWGRRFLAAFFALVAVLHLAAFSNVVQTNQDLTFSLLSFVAAGFAAAAVALRETPAAERPVAPNYRRYAVLSDQALIKDVARLLEDAARRRWTIGLMLVSVDVPAYAWQDPVRLGNAASRVLRDILLRCASEGDAVLPLRDSRVAFVARGMRTIAHLEAVADRVQVAARAEFARAAPLAGSSVTFGMSEANPMRGSADSLIRDASLALRRATALQTGRYVVSHPVD